jgi:transcriptional regulator with XRE-family HTH domain
MKLAKSRGVAPRKLRSKSTKLKKSERSSASDAVRKELQERVVARRRRIRNLQGTRELVGRVIRFRKHIGLSQNEIARVTGISLRSVAGIEAGQVVGSSALRKMRESNRLLSTLAQIIPEAELGAWMREPNPAFEGQTPIQVIERGESDRLWQMIFQIEDNVAS